jgi:hypothetical protein
VRADRERGVSPPLSFSPFGSSQIHCRVPLEKPNYLPQKWYQHYCACLKACPSIAVSAA